VTTRDCLLLPGFEGRYQVAGTVVSKRTSFQSLEITDTVGFGRALFLDGKPQSSQSDEHIYHEALVHPALIAHPAPRSVYIAGGAEGATLRDALRHPSVERVVMCDIDGEAVDFAREHMRSWHKGAFDDPRAEIVADDARAYLERSDERFDAVIVDVTDPLAGGPSCLLFTTEFYRLVRSRLRPGGLVAVQAESTSPGLLEGHAAIAATLGTVFKFARPYAAFIPFYADAWGFAVASDAVDPLALAPEEIDRRLADRGIETSFYDGETHQHLFALPRDVRVALRAAKTPITDDRPLIVA
jgi:spermidine synthase